jgi:hypothetical protein
VAEASAIREKLTAEAQGLAQKASSMKALDESGRGHEEFRLQIENQRAIALESLKVKKDIVAAQAHVMAEAMSKAKINIVGGDGQFFQRFVSAISLGQSVDGALEQSDTLRALVENIAGGDGSGGAVLAAALEKLAPKDPKGPGKRP